MKLCNRWWPCLVILLAQLSSADAQEPIVVGSGSYASFPPPGLVVDGKRKVDLVEEVEKRRLFLVNEDDRPIPSNKWYQNLLLHQYGTGLWALPHKVDATAEGIEFIYPTTFSGDGTRSLAEFPLVISGKDFKPTDSRAKDWSDWLVSFRLPQTETRFVDVTLGEGMPAAWCEFSGVEPLIAFGGQGGKGSRGKNPATFFDLEGRATNLPLTGDTLGINYEGRTYAVFAPDGTRFESNGSDIVITFAGQASFLVVCPLPSSKEIGLFHEYAFAIPRDTRLSWKYDRQAGRLSTALKISTELLKPNAKPAVIQGFLPHHWRENIAPLQLDGPSYTTIRGTLKCTAGNEFTLAYPFQGIVPNLPAASGLKTSRTKELLAKFYADPAKKLGGDTYWGGKEVERYAQAAFIAAQTKDPAFDVVVSKLRGSLENWMTYSAGERSQFFAWYPRHKALVGFPVAYGSQHFTDTHFHQGYFVYAAGLLSQLQPDFAAKYGDMARLIAKNYANYDLQDNRFPRFRTFDIWRGHSFADGKGFPEGNNQESTGEAVNSWAGMILLGEALGDEELTAAGVMGYSFETRANVEYWFDPHGDVFPENYAHNACGMIWCNSIVWGTWFTASPAWIYGIQWLPVAPHGGFYDRYPGLVKNAFADVQRELASFELKEAAKKGAEPKPVGIKALGGELGAYHLGFLMHAEPARAVEEFDKLWSEADDKVAHNEWMLVTYYMSAALAELGRIDWTAHGTSPTSTVYFNEPTKTRSLVAWNPTSKSQVVEFYSAGKKIGELEVAPHSLARKQVPRS